jgi:hypothetical protein
MPRHYSHIPPGAHCSIGHNHGGPFRHDYHNGGEVRILCKTCMDRIDKTRMRHPWLHMYDRTRNSVLHSLVTNHEITVRYTRTVQFAILAIQAVMLFMNVRSLWFDFKFLASFFVILAELCIVGHRWYYHVDGHADFHQITNAGNRLQVKAYHAIGLFGPVAFAGIVYFIAPVLEFSSLFFSFCSFLALILAGICAGIEIY